MSMMDMKMNKEKFATPIARGENTIAIIKGTTIVTIARYPSAVTITRGTIKNHYITLGSQVY